MSEVNVHTAHGEQVALIDLDLELSLLPDGVAAWILHAEPHEERPCGGEAKRATDSCHELNTRTSKATACAVRTSLVSHGELLLSLVSGQKAKEPSVQVRNVRNGGRKPILRQMA
jgi:hypothetical protein